MSMDNFYKPLNDDQRKLAFDSKWDFDSPESFDLDLLLEVLHDLKQGKKIQIPTYSFKDHNRTGKWVNIYGANVIILEGIYALYDPRVLELMDIKIFVDTDFDICLARRLHRDILHRGRELNLSIQQWDKFVKPNFHKYVKGTMNNADVLVPRGLDNVVAINMLSTQIRRQLHKKSEQHMNDLLLLGSGRNGFDKNSIALLCQSPQVRAMHTILLDNNSTRDDFTFYFDRLAGLLISRALDELTSYQPKTVVTPGDVVVEGMSLPYNDLCAITIIRGGECFNRALRTAVPTIRLGKILIQSDATTGEPALHTLSLPPCISPTKPGDADATRRPVLLVDAQMSSGAAATMATAILIDHGVQEEDIIVITYLASELALNRFTSAFPKTTVVVGRTHKEVLPRFIDARYFGTAD